MQYQTQTNTLVDKAVRSWVARPFVYGQTDCCSFCNFVVERLTGVRHLPAYATGEDADSILGVLGGLSAAVTFYMERQPIPAEDLRMGDVCYVEILGNQAVGIKMTNGNVAVVFEGSGLRELPGTFIRHGWSIWA